MTDRLTGREVPGWLRQVVDHAPADPLHIDPVLERRPPRGAGARPAAVLVLFAGAPDAEPSQPGGFPKDADVLLTQRASTMRQHRGQVAFPGGAMDPGDDGPVAAALREAREETGLDPNGVRPLALLPEIYIPPSGFDVTPVIAYWDRPSPVSVLDPAEVERVVRVPIRSLVASDNRFQVRHPGGYQGPAFSVEGMLVWGFTAGILAALLAVSGWEQPWDVQDIRELDDVLSGYGQDTVGAAKLSPDATVVER